MCYTHPSDENVCLIGKVEQTIPTVGKEMGEAVMPVRGKTRNDPPMQKRETAKGLFVQRGEVGEKPHDGIRKAALSVSPKARIGGKKTLTR